MDKTIRGNSGASGTNGARAGNPGTSGQPGGAASYTNNGNGVDRINSTEAYGGPGGGGGAGASNPTGTGGAGGASGAGGTATADTSTTIGAAAGVYVYADALGGTSGNAGIPGGGLASGRGSQGGAGGNAYAAAYAYDNSKNNHANPITALGLADAIAIAQGGTGGLAYGTGGSGGPGGYAFISANGQNGAAANGTSAYASAFQAGGLGGAGANGANGGAGASSTLTNAVSGRTTGGTLSLYQVAYGGSGGASNGGRPGAAGAGTSNLTFSDTTAATFDGTSGAVGGNGGSAGPAGGNGAVGGNATASLNLTGAHAVYAQSAFATGGQGGYADAATGASGNGAAGGTANAAATATSHTTGTENVSANATALGGSGGSAGINGGIGAGGAGGAATAASAVATEMTATGGTAYATVRAVGGPGGAAAGAGQHGGAGGAGGGVSATATGYSAIARAYQTGGAGGAGGADGGTGAGSTLTNAASGRTTGGALTLLQVATGGAGGYGAGAGGGTGGNGYSTLSFNDVTANPTQAISMNGAVFATGGAGGGAGAGAAGSGGNAGAYLTLTGGTAVQAYAGATSGAGGGGTTPGSSGRAVAHAYGTAAGTAVADAVATGGASTAPGSALAVSRAAAAAGQQATASSTATGIGVGATTNASTSGTGVVTAVDASTSAQGGRFIAATSTASIGGAVPLAGAGGDYASALGFANNPALESALIPPILAAAANVQINALLGTSAATILGYGTQGTFEESGANGQQTLTSTETFTLNPASLSGQLIAGLVGSNDNPGFTSLTFDATVDGTIVATQTFNAQGMATTPLGTETLAQFFTGDALDLGTVPTAAGPVVVSIGQTLVTSTGGSGFGASLVLAATPRAIETLLIPTNDLTPIELAAAGVWAGNVPTAGDTVSFGLASGATLTGSLDAAFAEFLAGSGPWKLDGATLTLAGVGDPLAMVVSTDVTLIGGTIAAAGSIDIEAAYGASLTSVGGEQIGAQGIVVGFDAGDSGALTVSGAGTSIENSGADGSLLVGGGGSGLFTVTDGASVTDAAVDTLGVVAGGAGELDVSAAGNLSDQGLIVGDAGLGSLAITAGGTVITDPGTGAAVIANQSGAGGSEVNVIGANSTWQLTGALLVGNADEGLLNIAGGATVAAASLDAGVLAGSDGNIAVTGTNTALNLTGQLTVGDQSTADLLISNDATVTALNADIGLTGNAGLSPVGAGVVDLEGAGSRLDILNNLNIGDGGTGVLVMDADTTLTVVNNLNIGATGALRQFGGVLDPATLTNTSESTTGSNGASLSVGRTLTNNGAYTVGPGEYTINVGTAEVSGGVTSYVGGTLNGSGLLVVGADGSNGTLVVNAGTVSGGQTVEFNNQATSEILTIGTLGGFGAVISNAINPTQGMEIIVAGVSIASVGFAGTTLTLFGAGDTTLGTLAFTGTVSSGVLTTNGSGGIIEVACFAAGTRIATERGEAAVEAIGVGDRVRVLLGGGLEGGGLESDGLEGGGLGGEGLGGEGLGGEGLGGGGFSEVIWVGRREIDCARHQQPRKVWPVRVAAGAFGAGLPHTDLWLSPDHAVYVNEVLIPVRYLVNGSTIAQVPVDRVTYHHIELARHDVLLAEGLPAESFLDMRDGSNYANRPGPVRLYPDYSARMWEAFGCAPLIVTGPELEAARALVASFAAERQAA